jgi:glycosyltransferase involved in cell wall biosynthesis
MIGRLSPQKAPLDFVEAAKLVLKSNPTVQFILVGDGPLTTDVEAAIGTESRIKMLGYRNDVPDILRILDIFALASLWEGLGRAMTEAMLMGIPVVATAVNGIPELVTHGETGLLSPPQSPAQLAKNLVRLLDNPQEAQRMSQEAQRRVAPRFGIDQMITQIEDVYEELMTAKGTGDRHHAAIMNSLPMGSGNAVNKSQ